MDTDDGWIGHHNRPDTAGLHTPPALLHRRHPAWCDRRLKKHDGGAPKYRIAQGALDRHFTLTDGLHLVAVGVFYRKVATKIY